MTGPSTQGARDHLFRDAELVAMIPSFAERADDIGRLSMRRYRGRRSFAFPLAFAMNVGVGVGVAVDWTWFIG